MLEQSAVEQWSRYFIHCGLQSDVNALHEESGTHAQEMEPGLRLIFPFTSWKGTLDHTIAQTNTSNTRTHINTHLLGSRVIMTFKLCTAPPSLLLGHKLCKWRVIHFIHSGTDQLYSNVYYRTISIVKSTVSANIQDREAIDLFSWIILTPTFSSINWGTDNTWRQTNHYGLPHNLSMACDWSINFVNTVYCTTILKPWHHKVNLDQKQMFNLGVCAFWNVHFWN